MGGLGALPDGSRYNIAIQNPAVAFRDPRLKASRPAVDRHGLPVVSAGGFAVAYRLDSPSGSWAVRCFTRVSEGLERRYGRVAAFLSANPSSHWVSVEFAAQGLFIDKSWWPMTLMPWVQGGATLNEWVAAKLGDRTALLAICQQFALVVSQLEEKGVAHGDLQHGNVLVTPSGTLVLIDYDGMFVPGLEGEKMPEVGHPHYQHPQRGTAAFGPRLDRFSAAVIWSALTAAAYEPRLWDRFDTGENLLFTGKDFVSPGTSELLAQLRLSTALRPLAGHLERLFEVTPDRLPSLGDFIAGKIPTPDPAVVTFGAIAPYPVTDLRRPGALVGRMGQRNIVVGEVGKQTTGHTFRGDPYLFLHLGSRGSKAMKVVLWSETLSRMTSQQIAGIAAGQVIAVTGMVSEYQGSPQIVLERPALIEALTSTQIRDLLGSDWADPPPVAAVAKNLQVGDVVEHDKFGQGVVLALRLDLAEVRFSAEVKTIQFTIYPLRLIRRSASQPKWTPPTAPRRQPPRPVAKSGYESVLADWTGLVDLAAGDDRRPTGSPTPAPTPIGRRGPPGSTPAPSTARPLPSKAPLGQPVVNLAATTRRHVLAVAMMIAAVASVGVAAQPGSDPMIPLAAALAGLVGAVWLLR